VRVVDGGYLDVSRFGGSDAPLLEAVVVLFADDRARMVEVGRVLTEGAVVFASLLVTVDLLRLWKLTGRRLGEAFLVAEDAASLGGSDVTVAGRRRERVRWTEAISHEDGREKMPTSFVVMVVVLVRL
jgi:hypothetical protein